MKKFGIYIAKILILLVLVSYACDLVFTLVYKNSFSRNKIEKILNGNPETFDVIFLGSSRANNHFIPKLFIEKGIKAYNFGMSGSRLQETALVLELLIEKNYKFNTVLLEVDLNINSEGYSEGTRAIFMPYLNTEKTISNYYKDKLDDFELLKFIPFYRYVKYDSQIGFREMFFTLIHKPSASILNDGFYALHGEGENMQYDLTKAFPKKNKDYELIKEICNKNKINLLVVSTPMCQNVKGIEYFEKIKSIYPEVINLENVISEDKYFASCGHLNEAGATKFTEVVINKLFH